MKAFIKYMQIITIIAVSAFLSCGGSVGGTPYNDIDDGLSSDYFLKSLKLEAPALADPEDPNASLLNLKYEFIPGEWQNEADVPDKVSSITITAELNHAWSSMSIGDNELVSGRASNPIALITGENLICIKVQAQDGQELLYTIKVTRHTEEHGMAEIASLSVTGEGLSLSPEFTPGTSVREFSANIKCETISLEAITAVTSDPDDRATVKIIANDDYVPNASALQLEAGMNIIQIIITAADGTTTDTYILKINRQVPTSSVKLASMSIEGSDFTEPFSPDTDTYYAEVKNPVNLTALPESSTGIVSVLLNNADVADPSAMILNRGLNTIMVTVTNGALSKDYQVKATCIAASDNAQLKSLKVTMGPNSARLIHPGTFTRDATYNNPDPLLAKFTKTQYDYVTVIYGINNVTVTAAVSDTTAKSCIVSATGHYGTASAAPVEVTTQSYSSTTGIATATVNLDQGYVTCIDFTVTAEDNTTQKTYHLYAKLLNSDEFYHGIYVHSFDTSKKSWTTPSGVSNTDYPGKKSGNANWKTGLGDGGYGGELGGAHSIITLTGFNDGELSLKYNYNGIMINGIQYADLKSATDKQGYNTSPGEYRVSTALGENVAYFYYHLRIVSSNPVQVDGETDPAKMSYTDMKYMGAAEWTRYKFYDVKYKLFDDTSYNWFEPLSRH